MNRLQNFLLAEEHYEHRKKHDYRIDTRAVGLFSTAADARISGDQIIPMMDTFLTQAMNSSSPVFNSCVKDNFVTTRQEQSSPWNKLHQTLIGAIAAGLVDDNQTFSIVANDVVQKYCGDSQLAGGDKKSK